MIAVYVFGGILLLLIISVLVGSLSEKEPTDPGSADLSPEDRQAAALEVLRDIEFEYQTGKLLEVDYVALRNRYAKFALGARDAISEQPQAAGRSCHACGEPFSGQVRFCPRCGIEQAVPPTDDRKTDDGEDGV